MALREAGVGRADFPMTLEEARAQGWLSLQEILRRLPPDCRLSVPTFKLWRSRQVIPSEFHPVVGPRIGRKGGKEAVWPPQLEQFLRDACQLARYVYIRGQRPRVPKGSRIDRNTSAASHATLRVVLWILGYEYEIPITRDSLGWSLLQYRESALRRASRIQKKLDRVEGGTEEALHHLAARHAKRLQREGWSTTEAAPKSAVELLETFAHLFFAGDRTSEATLFAVFGSGRSPFPEWWSITSMLRDLQHCPAATLNRMREDARTVLSPMIRIERYRRTFLSAARTLNLSELTGPERDLFAQVIPAAQQYLRREEFLARHLRHFPIFASTLLGLRLHGYAAEVQELDSWLRQIRERFVWLDLISPLLATLRRDSTCL